MTSTLGRILIIGAGQAGAQLAVSLRNEGHEGPISLIGDESMLPYERPPLSKGFLRGGEGEPEVTLHPADFYVDKRIEVLVGRSVTGVDTRQRAVELDDGTALEYDQLVFATGAAPRALPVEGHDLPGVMPLRDIEDARQVRETLKTHRDVVIIGGGYVGLELAAAARERGAKVTVIEALPRLLARTALPQTAEFVLKHHEASGVEFRLNTQVVGLEPSSDGRVAGVRVDSGELVPAGAVFYGIGVIPRTELAVAAKIEVGNGIRVDEQLRTSIPGVWAIGDCCEFPSTFAGMNVRLESVQNAVDQARYLAKVLAGTPHEPAYAAVPWFWSDQGELKVQSVGFVRDHDTAIAVESGVAGAFSILAFKDNIFVGADSVNRPGDQVQLRRLYGARSRLDSFTAELVSADGFDLRLAVKDLLQ